MNWEIIVDEKNAVTQLFSRNCTQNEAEFIKKLIIAQKQILFSLEVARMDMVLHT